jgi:2'-hydroxyisoflavone reductase
MKILIIGGTQFVGLAIAREAIQRGHDVDIFHRSDKIPSGTGNARHLKGDRNRDVTALQTGTWDAVIDVCGYRPHEINALADVFADRIGKYVFISTCSVYDVLQIKPDSDESAPQVPLKNLYGVDPIDCPIDAKTYGALKVLCEQAVRLHYIDNLILRPVYVLGKDDHTKRFNIWVERFMTNETVEVPTPLDAPFQYVSADDLAHFTLKAIEDNLTGDFHLAAPSGGMTFGKMIEEIQSTLNSTSTVSWIDKREALERESGTFPFWQPDVYHLLTLNTKKAVDHGFQSQSLTDIINEVKESLSK